MKGLARVAEKRAEILGMITRLRAGSRALPRTRRTATVASSPQVTISRAPPSNAGAVSQGPSLDAVMHVLSSLEARLARIEGQLGARAPSTGALLASELVGARPRVSVMPARPPQPVDSTFSGVIRGQMLSDMLQLVSSNSMTGVFVIETETCQCTLYFNEGHICHAVSGELVGEDAFFAAFGAQSGRYHFTESTDLPQEKTVSAGTQFLVLEALRRMDESRA